MAAKEKAGKLASPGYTLAEVRALARVMRQYDLSELELEHEQARVFLRRGAPGAEAVQVVPAPASPGTPPPAGHSGAAAEAPEDDGLQLITSPFVGTFYRAPSPEAAPFVAAGATVHKGQTLCIVEAMKLMNEIESEFDAKIVEILAKNAEPVEYGQGLFKVLPV